MIFYLVSATSIAPKLSSSSPSDTSQTIVVPEDAANAVFKFADNSLRLTVDAGMWTKSVGLTASSSFFSSVL